jgi:DNA adenine methylase
MSDDDHRHLATSLHATTATVLLSGYPTDLYDVELYPGWWRHEIATTATVGESGGRARTEVVWSNRPLNSQLRLLNEAIE